MQSLAQQFAEVKCGRCPALVVMAEGPNGGTLKIERAKGRTGGARLTGSLFGNPPRVELGKRGSRWKVHRCDPQAFSAGSFDRKVRP